MCQYVQCLRILAILIDWFTTNRLLALLISKPQEAVSVPFTDYCRCFDMCSLRTPCMSKREADATDKSSERSSLVTSRTFLWNLLEDSGVYPHPKSGEFQVRARQIRASPASRALALKWILDGSPGIWNLQRICRYHMKPSTSVIPGWIYLRLMAQVCAFCSHP